MSEPITLLNCDREPIHIPGSIQGHGAMLVLDSETYTLRFASRNTSSVTGYKGELKPGLDIEHIIGARAVHDLRNATAKGVPPLSSGIVLGLELPHTPGLFDAVIHTHDGRILVEIEPCLDQGQSARQTLDLTRTMIHRVGLENRVDAIAATGAKLVRAMLGYDRVMVYRFLHNGAGRVIAEAKDRSIGSFLGQHFPASDIPVQARRLYLINSIRMIVDSTYKPVVLDPPLSPGEPPIDMSHAQLRSVSPIHCEYLRNMGVKGSLSISIIVDGELWGLISCHHNSPKLTPLPLRLGAELFGHYFSLQIAEAERRAAMLTAARARSRLDAIVSNLSGGDLLTQGLVALLPDFASLVECDGVGVWMDGVWSSFGSSLDPQSALALIEIAKRELPNAIWTTQEIRAHLSDIQTPVAGAMAIPLSTAFGNYLILFRNEEAHDIEWAGEPVKTIVHTETGDRLTPRGSFETWRQEVKDRSTPWTDADLSVAEAIRTYLRDVILRQSEVTAEERARTEQRRRILNAELNHRVKNILSLVKSIAVQTGNNAATVAEYSTSLEGRIRALAFAHDQSLNGTGGGDLQALVNTEAGLHQHANSHARISLSGPPVHLDERAFGIVALVVHEMMTNAVKYGALSVAEGKIDITWKLSSTGDCHLDWVESNGPKISAPTSVGFGNKLIFSTVEYDLKGSAELTFPSTGLRARFRIPANHVAVSAPTASSSQPAPTPADHLSNLSILLVEDQALIGLDAQETLLGLGAKDVRLSYSAEDAAHQLTTFAPDVAVLDFNLGDDTSTAVADLLHERGIPFLFTTGYTDRSLIPARYQGVPLVRKPIDATAIAAQIGALVTAKKALDPSTHS